MDQFQYSMYDQETSEAMKKYVQKAIMELHHTRKPDQSAADTNRQYFKIHNHGNVNHSERGRMGKGRSIGISDTVREFFHQKIAPFPRRFREALTRNLNGRKILERSVCNTTRDDYRNSMSSNLNRALLELYTATRKNQLANNSISNIKHGMISDNVIRNKNSCSGDYGMAPAINKDVNSGGDDKYNSFMNASCDSRSLDNSKNSNNKSNNDDGKNEGVTYEEDSNKDVGNTVNNIHVMMDDNDSFKLQTSNKKNEKQRDSDNGDNRNDIVIENQSHNKFNNDNHNDFDLNNNTIDNKINYNIYSTISNNAPNTVVSCKPVTSSDPEVIENIDTRSNEVAMIRSLDTVQHIHATPPPLPLPFTLHMSRNATKRKKNKIQSKDLLRSRNQLRKMSKRVRKHFTRAYKKWNKCRNKYSRMGIVDDEMEQENLINDDFQTLYNEVNVFPPMSPIFASRVSTNFPTTTVQGRHMSQQVRVIDVVSRIDQKPNHQNQHQDMFDSSIEVEQVKQTKNEEFFQPRRVASRQQMPLLIGCGALSKGKTVLDVSKKIKNHIKKAPKKWRSRCIEKWNGANNKSQMGRECNQQNENPMKAHVNDALKDLYRVAKPTIMFANAMSSEPSTRRNTLPSDNVYATVKACPWSSHRSRPSEVVHHSMDANNYVTLNRNTRPVIVPRKKSSGSMFADLRTNIRMADKKRKECSGFIRRQCSLRRNNEVRLLEGF